MCVLETSGANVGGLMVNLALGLDDSGVLYIHLTNIDNSTNWVFICIIMNLFHYHIMYLPIKYVCPVVSLGGVF